MCHAASKGVRFQVQRIAENFFQPCDASYVGCRGTPWRARALVTDRQSLARPERSRRVAGIQCDESFAILIQCLEADRLAAQMPPRHQAAKVAVAFVVLRQQHQPRAGPRERCFQLAVVCGFPSFDPEVSGSSFSFHRWPLTTDHWPLYVQHRADNRLYAGRARLLHERHRGVEAVGVGERHSAAAQRLGQGGAFRAGLRLRRGDDFLRRRHRPQERVMTVAVKMNEHGNLKFKDLENNLGR